MSVSFLAHLSFISDIYHRVATKLVSAIFFLLELRGAEINKQKKMEVTHNVITLIHLKVMFSGHVPPLTLPLSRVADDTRARAGGASVL